MAPQIPFPLGVAPTPAAGVSMAQPVVPSASVMMMPSFNDQPAAAVPATSPTMPIDMTKINPYIYMPSFSMAVVGSMAFLLLATIHTIQLIKTRAWYFFVMQNAPLVVAASLIARTHSAVTLPNTGATGPFIVFKLLDMTSGTITSIGIVFTYTRVMWWVTPDDKRNFSTLWTPVFWTSFLWGFLLFIGDAAKAVAQNALKRTNPLSFKIQIIAVIYQFFVLSAFTFTTYRFMMISRRWMIHGECEEKNWRALGWTVVICAAIVNVRHAFTIVHLDARADPMGFYSQHEWVYWVAESLPLLIVYALFSLSYPGFFLPREYTGFRIKLKEIAAAKVDGSWPMNISPPFPIRAPRMSDDKYIEASIMLTEDGKRR